MVAAATMTRIVRWLACGFGAGNVPLIPGTVGTLWGVVLAAALAPLPVGHFVIVTIVFVVFAAWLADQALPQFDSRDPKAIVVDEVAGYLVTLVGHGWSGGLALLAFVLFRLFDIGKPPPCRRLERLPGGVGIVADDVMAGLYANGLLWIIKGWFSI
ncbi:MAG: phosphatidylglycerophosphatase A [Deltaproteobacteria bacterium]|nr:phosphatidylglycerophosphatase A [Deltaproteobacteria bacterium]